jgi:2-oxoglutarate ferredoxin oxidoreductase subunit beta
VREEKENRIYLRHGEPIRFGLEGAERGVVREADGSVRVVPVAEVGEDALLVHDAHAVEPSLAFALSRLTGATAGAVPMGIFRSVERPVYDELMSEQLAVAAERQGEGDLAGLLHAGDTWTIA